MRRLEGAGHLQCETTCIGIRKRSAERTPFDVLEHDVVRADVVNLTDVRMVQRGDRTRFLLEPANPVSVGGKGLWKHLDGDIALEAHIARFPHFAHTAGTKTRRNFIRTDSAARADRHSWHYLPEQQTVTKLRDSAGQRCSFRFAYAAAMFALRRRS